MSGPRMLPFRSVYGLLGVWVGGVLVSHTLPGAVPSALEGLATGFGKDPGVSHSAIATDPHTQTSPITPEQVCVVSIYSCCTPRVVVVWDTV
jgi:hypothetical protein